MADCNMQVTQTSSNSVQKNPFPWGAKVSLLAFALILGIGIGAAILDNAYDIHNCYWEYGQTDLFALAFIATSVGGILVALSSSALVAGKEIPTKDKIKYSIYILGCITLGIFGGLSFGKELINMEAWERFQATLPDNFKTHVGPEYEIVGITGTIITGGTLVGLVFFTNCIERLAQWLEDRGKALRAKLAGEEVENGRL